jgi:hypothetical protein
MNAYDRAARALLGLRADIDNGSAGDHRAAALGAVLELWAGGAADAWVRAAVEQLCRPLQSGEFRTIVDDCLQRATQAFVADATSTRRSTTLLPPPSGDEEREERAAARASLESIELRCDARDWGAPPAYSTVPASAEWFDVEERRAMGGGLRL